jgi:predicted glutamine amidotransferase
MCGIFGIINKNNTTGTATTAAWNSLMESSLSRGKDSSGIAFIDSDSSRVDIVKGNIPLNMLLKSNEYQQSYKKAMKLPTFFAMGHTRLVTNGSSLDNGNNQPVCAGEDLLVHNGIIVNAEDLWSKNSELIRENEIDSEVILKCLKSELVNHPFDFIQKTNVQLKGTYSYACVFPSRNWLILSSNNGSLYYINDQSKFYFASERVFLERAITQSSDYIHQITGGEFVIFDFDDLILFENEVPPPPIDSYSNHTEDEEPFEIVIRDINSSHQGVKVMDVRNFSSPQYSAQRALLEFNWDEIKYLKRCTKCVLPETFPFIAFDHEGICNYCHSSKPIQTKGNLDDFAREIQPFIKRSNHNCIVPLSGGRDSIFSLHLVKEKLGLSPVTMTYDWGMVTDLARRNIARVCGELGVENVIFAADSDLKRKNIRLNLTAWLKNPHLGMVPLFMAGDKYFFHYCSVLQKNLGIDLNIWGAHQFENTDFKVGFAGVSPNFEKEKIYSLSLTQKMKLVGFVVNQFLSNASYLNASLWDTIGAYKARDQFDFSGHFQIFDYFDWDERQILEVIESKYGWERAIDSDSTWRIGDGTSSFYNYIYFVMAGFSEVETFRSNQIRNGKLTREEAMKRIEQENQPRFESIKWYLHMIGMDYESVIKRINAMPKLYRK